VGIEERQDEPMNRGLALKRYFFRLPLFFDGYLLLNLLKVNVAASTAAFGATGRIFSAELLPHQVAQISKSQYK